MPVIKVDLPQEVLEELAILAYRHMVATRVMAGDVIAAYLNAAQQCVQSDGGVCTCRKPIATTSTNNQCGCCGKPRRR